MFDYLLKDFRTSSMPTTHPAAPDALDFRHAQKEDVPAIVKLVESVYRGDSSRKGWTTEADLLGGQRTDPDMILNLLNDSECHFLLAINKSQIVGSVLIEKKRDYAYLGMLAVDVSLQNAKLGRRLLEAAESFTKNSWQLNEVRITVIEQRRELVEWYERRGYKKTGAVSDFPTDPRFGIPKVKISDLHFIELAKPV
jgi:ribosomal protein S18 acetylase RimI-like enzyme